MRHYSLLFLIAILLTGCSSTQRGKLTETDRPLDFAIDGEGYFILDSGHGGYLFTRHGNFSIDTNRTLVNADGYKLAPLVVIPDGATDIRVSIDGKITVRNARERLEPAGQIRLALFPKPDALDRDGEYSLPTPTSGDPTTHPPGSGGAGTVRQRMLER